MEIEQDIEAFAEKVGVEVETLADEGYQKFVSVTKPLYDDLLAYAKTTGKADVGVLLNDLKQDLITGVTTLATTGGNTGAAIAATASQALSQDTRCRCIPTPNNNP